MATKTAKKATKKAKGIRYSEDEKNKVVEFVRNFDMEKGRGGVAEAVRKFGVTAMTIGSWVKKSGKGGSRPAAKKAGKRARGGDRRSAALAELVDLQGQISRGRAELEKLEARFEELKKEL